MSILTQGIDLGRKAAGFTRFVDDATGIIPVLYDGVHRTAGTACRRNRGLARPGQIARAAFFTGAAADDKMEADKRKGTMRMRLGTNLSYLRRLHGGMTQERLAERLMVSRQTVSKWETGGSLR